MLRCPNVLLHKAFTEVCCPPSSVLWVERELTDFQSACRPGYSTETAVLCVLNVLNDILCSTGGGHLVLLVLLDLSAAFDTIDHSISLLRLHNEFGFIGSAHRWFRSYHADLSQHVTIHL